MITRVLLGTAAVAVAGLVPHVASAQTSADITLVHGLAGVTADIVIDGTVVIDGFLAGSLADISAFAGRTLTDVTVIDDDTDEVLIGPMATLAVPDSGSHSVVAHFDENNEPTLTTFANNTQPTQDGMARVTIRHTAQAGAIDLVIGDQRPVVGAVNGDNAELELPAGDLSDAALAASGGAELADIATIGLAANTNTIIYAVGSADDDTLQFVVQVVNLAGAATTTSVVASAGATTTTAAGATTTTTTTVAGATTTTNPVPTAVNTGSPIGGPSSTMLIGIALGGLTLAGGAMLARRRV